MTLLPGQTQTMPFAHPHIDDIIAAIDFVQQHE